MRKRAREPEGQRARVPQLARDQESDRVTEQQRERQRATESDRE